MISDEFRKRSFWLEHGEYEPAPSLAGSRNADVVIVGGGFTGLSAAYFLKRSDPSLKIALLEREAIGFGASGRNAGFIMPLLGWNIPDVYERLGHERTQAAYDFMYEAMEHIASMVREHAIACDYEKTGYVMFAMNDARMRALEREVDLARKMGFEHRAFDRRGVAEFIRSTAFAGGFFDPRCSIFNPALFARGMRRVVRELGVDVYERSPVIAIDEGRTVRVRTEHGDITAPKLVLATNAYTPELGYLQHRIMPVFTYVVLTEPLSDAQIRELGWQKRTSLETARNLIHYFRLTADNRILFGGEDAQYSYANGNRDDDEDIYRRLRARLVEFFPSLADIRFTHAWGGPIAFTLDMLPTVGVTGVHENIYYSTGCCGHGVSITNYSGRVLADLVFERDTERSRLFFVHRKPLRIPPEPFRWMCAQSYRRVLQAQDWWEARRDQKMAARSPGQVAT